MKIKKLDITMNNDCGSVALSRLDGSVVNFKINFPMIDENKKESLACLEYEVLKIFLNPTEINMISDYRKSNGGEWVGCERI